MKTKDEIDAAARLAGFHDSDYPFYGSCNGCGPNGWKGKLVPDKSHLWEGVDFKPSCNKHDHDYMTTGVERDKADAMFRTGQWNVHAAAFRFEGSEMPR